MALLLRKRGIDRVRPLVGGFDAWLAAGLPVDPIELEARPGQESETGSTSAPGSSGASA